MKPAPQRRKPGRSWAQCLKLHGEGVAATAFFPGAVATWHGLGTSDVLVVRELATRRVQIVGLTPQPTAAFRQPCARQRTDPFDGCLLGKRYRLQDSDTKCTHAFDAGLQASGVAPIGLPPRRPNLPAHGARVVRSLKEAALEPLGMLGECALSDAIHQSVSHSHAERHPQGLDHQRMAPERGMGSDSGQGKRRPHLGGLLRDYDRDAG